MVLIERLKGALSDMKEKWIRLPRNIQIAIGTVAFLIIFFLFISGRTDLSGTYYTCTFFPVSQITFNTDGTFIAYNEYEILEGKYRKKGSTYTLKFIDGKSKSGNPVSNYQASRAGNEFELEAEKISESQLRVYVIPKMNYLAWYGESADFYMLY